MGGIVAFELARRHPELVAGVAMIDAAVVRPDASRARLPAFIERLSGPDAIPAVSDYVRRALFLPTDDAARREQIITAMARTPQHVIVAALQGMYDFHPDGAAGKALPPALFIATNGPPLCDLGRLAAIVPGLMTAQTAGSGHFAPLEVPDQVNAMLTRFVALVDAGLPAPHSS
jgi:pimeloyl-ACP methyl ester carboxylesterase